jgi:hypothetical protein
MKILVFITMMEIPNQESGNHSDFLYHFSAVAGCRFRTELAGLVCLNREIYFQTPSSVPRMAKVFLEWVKMRHI